MKIFPLADEETIQPVGRYSTYQHDHIMIPRAESVKHCVGTIEIPGIARGTACLLNNGQILTCLHTILDYQKIADKKLELIDFTRQQAFAYFVKDNKLYQYEITGVAASGMDKLQAYGTRAICFDYAFLAVERNPVLDLGSGFAPDNNNGFSAAFATDPFKTLAISGPYLTVSKRGISAHRYVSLSNNQAAESAYHHFAQLGEHPTAPGFSGQAMVPIENRDRVLYALHSYRDNQGQQTGVKISEIRSSLQYAAESNSGTQHDDFLFHTLLNWYEVLKSASISGVGVMKIGSEITFDEAVKRLEQGKDIIGDNRKEVEPVAKKAWGNKLLRHDPHMPQGCSHFHHPNHTASQNPGHAFYQKGVSQGRGTHK